MEKSHGPSNGDAPLMSARVQLQTRTQLAHTAMGLIRTIADVQLASDAFFTALDSVDPLAPQAAAQHFATALAGMLDGHAELMRSLVEMGRAMTDAAHGPWEN